MPLAGDPWSAIAIASVSMVGGGAMYTLVTADLLARMPRESISLAGGILAGAQSLALIATSPLIGGLVDANGDYIAVTIALGAWVVPGAVIWLAWRPADMLQIGRDLPRARAL